MESRSATGGKFGMKISAGANRGETALVAVSKAYISVSKIPPEQ